MLCLSHTDTARKMVFFVAAMKGEKKFGFKMNVMAFVIFCLVAFLLYVHLVFVCTDLNKDKSSI